MRTAISFTAGAGCAVAGGAGGSAARKASATEGAAEEVAALAIFPVAGAAARVPIASGICRAKSLEPSLPDAPLDAAAAVTAGTEPSWASGWVLESVPAKVAAAGCLGFSTAGVGSGWASASGGAATAISGSDDGAAGVCAAAAAGTAAVRLAPAGGGAFGSATGVSRRPNASGAVTAGFEAAGIMAAPKGSLEVLFFEPESEARAVSTDGLLVSDPSRGDWIIASSAGGTTGALGDEAGLSSWAGPAGILFIGAAFGWEAVRPEEVSDATLAEEVNIERIIASASCAAGTAAAAAEAEAEAAAEAEAEPEVCGDGAEGASDASASSRGSPASPAFTASPCLAAGACDPRSKLIRLLNPAGNEGADAVLPGIASMAGKAGCAFLAAATAFTPVANAVPAPKRKDLNSSD